MTCKILALVDSLGNLIKFRLMPGQYHDLVETKPSTKSGDSIIKYYVLRDSGEFIILLRWGLSRE